MGIGIGNGLLDRARGAKLEEAGEQHRPRPDAEKEREQMDVEDVVVRVQGSSCGETLALPRLGDCADGFKRRDLRPHPVQ